MTDGAFSARSDLLRPGTPPGKKATPRGVVDIEQSAGDCCRHDLEDPTTTTQPGSSAASVAAPVSMAHLEQYTDAEWVEPADELTGTAVFDATGDKAAMPSLGRTRPPARRPGIPVGLPPVRESARRRGPDAGNVHPGVPLACRTTSPARSRAGCTASPPTCSSIWSAVAAASAWKRCPRITTGCLRTKPNPEQIYHDSRLGPDLQAALDSLPPEFRAAVVLCDIEGLSYEEIGATLGVKLGTVRSRIHRGRQALRDHLARHSDAGTADGFRDAARSA